MACMIAALLLLLGLAQGLRDEDVSASLSFDEDEASIGGNPVEGNPFAGKVFYKNPANQRSYDGSIATSKGAVMENLAKMREVPSAYWIDVKAKIKGTGPKSLEGILKDAASKSPAELVTFIWYDLPNRDCHAKASNGEICCKKKPDGTCDYTHQTECEDGLKEYKETYAAPFVEVLQKYSSKVPVVIIMEPDSLPNLATNQADPRCGGQATKDAYMKGIKYSIDLLTTETPEVAVYLDAAHGGWLGWQDKLEDFMKLLKTMQLPVEKMRGFATNVANYQPLGALCPFAPDNGNRNGYCLNGRHSSEACCADPCGIAKDWSAGNNELNYAQQLSVTAKAVLGMEAHMVIDTGRNGQTSMRQACKNWCNIRGAGAGHASTASTGAPDIVDAYFWLKTPGESDGCTEKLPAGIDCPRFDHDCASEDSLGSKSREPRAPEAGAWFDYQVKQLAQNARLDGGGGAPSSSPTPSASTPPAPTPSDNGDDEANPKPSEQEVKPHKQDGTTSGASFCCNYGDSCGSCQSPTKPGEWCGQSTTNCKKCNGFFCAGSDQSDGAGKDGSDSEGEDNSANSGSDSEGKDGSDSPEEEESESAAFCCTYGDSCGSCGSKAAPDNWCSISSTNCKQCSGIFCDGTSGGSSPGGGGGAGEEATPAPATLAPAPTAREPTIAPAPTPSSGGGGAGDGKWDGTMKLTHYWDCSGQGCDSGTLDWGKFRPRYISTPGYAPQDPADHGGAKYGEKIWLTGAASDFLSKILGPDDGCCGSDPNDDGVGGCGKCVLLQNPQAENADWTVVAMKKNRCPPWSNGCKDESHFDLAVPGFDNQQYSTANICGKKEGTGFATQEQSFTLGMWYNQCESTSKCAHLCDKLPPDFQKGCKLFASWGWNNYKADPVVKFKHVDCPEAFVKHVGKQFAKDGPTYFKK